MEVKDLMIMEVKDLMIGNYVNEDHVVVGILLDMIETDKDAEMLLDTIEPIQLTEEWLERFGLFKRKNQSSRYVYLDGYYDIGKCHLFNEGDGNFTLLTISYVHEDGIEICSIKHVHHLQNVYHAITGEELTLK